jgi:cytochrome P450 family 138
LLLSESDPRYSLPPGPPTPKWVNGAIFLLGRSPMLQMLQRRYGDAYTLRLPYFGNFVVVGTPDLIKKVYTAKPDVLHGGKNPLGEVLGPGSLFSMDEDEHLKERRMLLPPFHGERMKSYEALIEEEADAAFASWRDGEEFATQTSFNKITLRVILRAVFGAEGQELAALERLLPAMTKLGQRLVTAPFLRRDFGPWSPGGKLASMEERFRVLVNRLIDDHLADPDLDERVDILALILRSLQEAGEDIDRTAIAEELITLLVAGHETTTSSLAWTVERVTRHPEVLRRLEEEAAGDDATYRTAVINEIQRVRPVITGTGRVVVADDFELGQWKLKPGTVIMTSASLVHDDERFHKGAGTFDPDRYVGRKPDTYAWIPFGGGMRRCLGAAFALFEIDVVLRTLLRNFELQPTTAAAEKPSFKGVAFAPAKGGRATGRRRRTPLAAGPATARVPICAA